MTEVPRRVVAAYAAPSFALALLGVAVYVHLPRFYAEVAGAHLSLLGAAIFLTRTWDAVLDPAIGAWSDRTRTRWGRRRPFLVVAAPLLAVSVWVLFRPPAGASPDAAAWYFAAAMALSFLGWTLVAIPHASLGPEIARGYHARTRLFAAREGTWIVGTLAAAAAPAIVRGLVPGADERTVFAWLGTSYAVVLLALPWWCAAVVREAAPDAAVPADWPRVRTLRRNRPFVILLAAYGIAAVGGGLPATLLLFYVEYVIGAARWADGFLALYFLSGFACLPLWLRLARRVGKKPAWLWAMGVSIAAFAGALLLGRGDAAWFAVVVAVSGTGFGAGLVLPASMQADTIDYGEWQDGARREGAYLGLWAVVTKGAAAAGAAAALPLLDWAGFVPGRDQAPAVLLALKILYAGVPCASYLAALAVAARYPIDEAVHDRVRASLAARAQTGSSAAPVVPVESPPLAAGDEMARRSPGATRH